MSFFKDFKADFTQAMNELMPDGNEMYDEDEVIEEAVEEIAEEEQESPKKEKKTKEKPAKDKAVKEKAVKEKKATRPKKSKEEQEEQAESQTKLPRRKKAASAEKNEEALAEENIDEILGSMESVAEEISNQETMAANGTSSEEMEIAPEDMLEQIDDLLDKELYSDVSDPQMLLNDDMEVNTMDMSVEELLNQLAMKQNVAEEDLPDSIEVEEEGMDSASEMRMREEAEEETEEETEEEPSLSIDDLLSQLDAASTMSDEAEETLPEIAQKSETETEGYIHEPDLGLEALLNSIANDSKQTTAALEEIMEPKEALTEESVEEVAEEIAEPEAELVEEVVEETTEEVVEETAEPEELVEEMVEEITEEVVEETAEPEEEMVGEAVEETIEEVVEETIEPEEIVEEALSEEMVEERMEEASEVGEAADAEAETAPLEEALDATEEAKLDEILEKFEDNIEEQAEDDTMGQDKDVISINATEEAKEDKRNKEVEETVFNVEEADPDTTYITKGTKIKGDLETEGSIDIIGAVEGSVICKGKVVVGGNVVGNITAGELYANSARIEGNVKSYGSVKVGVGTMIIGGIEGESAVIAGAVNGDIDVKGPVIVDSTAVIMGNIKSRSVQINNGAVIEGFCSQSYSDIDVKSFFA